MKSVVIALLLLIVICCIDAKCPKCSKAETCLGCTRTAHCVWCDGVCDSSLDSTLSCVSRIEAPEDCSAGCTYGGKKYAAGETFMDDCNTCACSEDGSVYCTEMACIPIPSTCEYNGKTYQNGEGFPSDDGCNTCSCSNGHVICTLMACFEGCQTNADCGSGYCKKSSCDDHDGTCTNTEELCTTEYDPVCGCDGKTYGNDCEAAIAGVNIKSEGECEGSSQTCKTDYDCESEQFCQKDSCDSEEGTCSIRSEFCTKIFSPVCGCDDKTYSNDCEAHAAGVNVKSEGECEGSSQTCKIDEECESEQFCQKDSCDSEEGTCSVRSELCTKIYSPVCGCDDETYSNDCVAHAAGVNVKSKGECEGGEEPEGDCESTYDCVSGYFCKKASCDDAKGSCVDNTELCADIYAPVCGCDDTTYSNDCEAARVGVNVKSEGECVPPQVTCKTNDDCESGQYCVKDSCDDSQDGSCTDNSELCSALFDPVCGCDGKTYGNDCEAAGAGVNIKSKGECEGGSENVCQTNADCKSGWFCEKETCDDETQGYCTEIFAQCIDLDDPVCGCDGHTYGNACEAAREGINVDHAGDCEEGKCKSNDDCDAGYFCEKNPCDPDSEFCILNQCDPNADGLCTIQTDFCAAIHAPVCGCDGNTYSNSCVAHNAGINVKSSGQCDAEENETMSSHHGR